MSKSESNDVFEEVHQQGGLFPGVVKKISAKIGKPEAQVFGASSFYHLLSDEPDTLRICTGLSCSMNGARQLLAHCQDKDMNVKAVSCLAACDKAPAALKNRHTLVELTTHNIQTKSAEANASQAKEPSDFFFRGAIGSGKIAKEHLAMNLSGTATHQGEAYKLAQTMAPKVLLELITASGLQGRGGAGFPTGIKWKGVYEQPGPLKYIALNADEGEPGTFKDRDTMIFRPDLVIEGLAIAASLLKVKDVYLYMRGAFKQPWQELEKALQSFAKGPLGKTTDFNDIQFHFHSGHGAYICGEETAMLEALEGKRGMPRLKPPYPHEVGLWGKPTLIQNVETIACVPGIVKNGAKWFKKLGHEESGTKLYSISGDVKVPGTYELPLGVSLDELVEAAGGYVGELKCFSPGGASSGFLPASKRTIPLSFKALAKEGSMMGSAGVVVLNTTRDMKQAVIDQLEFFEVESCGQCAPCRIGTKVLHNALKNKTDKKSLSLIEDVSWEMVEGSICGLGQTAPLPLTSAMKYFPEEF